MKLKDIKNIDDVTVVELLEILKRELKLSFEDLIQILPYSLRATPKDKIQIETDFKEKGLFLTKEKRQSLLLEITIKKLNKNNDNITKKELLLTLYHNMNNGKYSLSSGLSEIKRLVLDGNDGAVCLKKTKKGQYEYEIVTKEKQKSIDEIKSNNLKRLSKFFIKTMLHKEDLPGISKNEEIGEAIVNKVLLDFDRERKVIEKPIEDIEENLYEKIDERLQEIASELEKTEYLKDEFDRYFKNFILNNMQYIDTNKLLFNGATRIILGIKAKKGEKLKYVRLTETKVEDESTNNEVETEEESTLKTSIYFLRNLYNELSRNTKAKNMIYSLYGEDKETIINVDLEYIKNFLSRCTEDNYLTDANIQEIHEKIKAGELPESLEERRIANIDIDDLLNLSKSFELQEDKEGKEKLKECSVDLINYLKNEKLLSDEGIIELYIEGKFNKDILENIELPDVSDKYYINTYKRLYGETLNDRNLEKIKKFSRFANYCDNASKNGKLDKYDMFLDFMEEYGEDNILDLYKLEAISLEECVDYVGTDILDKMFESTNRTIQPIELRKLYYDGVLDFNKMSSLINKIPTEEEKYITIITIFPDEEDSKIRKDLIDNTIVVDSSVQDKGKRKRKNIDIDNDDKDKGKDYKKHITDSTYRFQLIKNLDEKYYAEMTKDGHIVLTLPKFKKVIIEKILDKNRQEGYGAATYILDEDYYRENEEEINQEGKIDRTKLVEANQNNEAKKIRHTIRTWGKDVKTYFESLQGTEYTKEESEKIDEIIEKIKNSERLVGD